MSGRRLLKYRCCMSITPKSKLTANIPEGLLLVLLLIGMAAGL